MGLIKKRIVIVFNDLSIGGIERKIVDICSYYSKKKEKEIILLLKSKKGELLKLIPKNIKIISPNKNSVLVKNLIFPWWLSRQFNKIEPNLVISFGNYSAISSVLARSISFFKPKVIISDDSGLEKQIKKETFSIVRKELIKITYPVADKIILLTEFGKNELIKLIPNIEFKKIVVKKNWLPFGFKKNKFKQKRNVDILFLARFESQKNPIKFLEIVKKIKDEKNDIKVYMVGYGSLKNDIEKFIKKNSLIKNVKVCNPTTNPSNYYQKSKLLILTSNYEGFPLTILESFSCGCVSVSNKISEIFDFFQKYSEDVLYKDINEAVDKILSLLANQKKLDKICSYYQKKIFLEQKINFKETVNEFEKYC